MFDFYDKIKLNVILIKIYPIYKMDDYKLMIKRL